MLPYKVLASVVAVVGAVRVLNDTTCSHGIEGWRAVSGDGLSHNDFWYSVSSLFS